MEYKIRRLDKVVILDLKGKINFATGTKRLRRVINYLINNGNKNIILNLSEVTYADSSGISELVKSHIAVVNNNGKLALVMVPKEIEKLLKITKLFSVFKTYKLEKTAIQAF